MARGIKAKAPASSRSGFTIVELLIVIVVIAILAAISTVAFIGVQNRARESSVISALNQATKKIAVTKVDNATDLTCASFYALMTSKTDSTNCNFSVDDIGYQYKPGVEGAYCITATNARVSYKVSEAGPPTTGACAGHGSGGVAAITNLVQNPSVETNLSGWSGANGAVLTRQASSAIFASQGVRVVTSNAVDSGPQVSTSGISVTAGTQYTASLSIRAITPASYSLSVQGVGGTSSRDIKTLSAGQVARFSLTWTPVTSGGIAFFALKQGSQSGTFTFDVDGAMLVTNSTASVYADGNTTGWDWTGTVNNSTSSGPPQ